MNKKLLFFVFCFLQNRSLFGTNDISDKIKNGYMYVDSKSWQSKIDRLSSQEKQNFEKFSNTFTKHIKEFFEKNPSSKEILHNILQEYGYSEPVFSLTCDIYKKFDAPLIIEKHSEQDYTFLLGQIIVKKNEISSLGNKEIISAGTLTIPLKNETKEKLQKIIDSVEENFKEKINSTLMARASTRAFGNFIADAIGSDCKINFEHTLTINPLLKK